MNTSDYQTHVQKHRPNIKENSAHTYAVTLRSIAPKDATDFSWVTDTDYVFKAIEKYKDNTRKNILNALIVVLPKDSEEFKTYTKERDHYNQLYTDHNKARKKTESQEKNWVEWPDYKAMVKELGQEAKALRGTLSARERVRFQDYLIALLYSHYPLRNDFGDVRVITRAKFKKLPASKSENYLVKDKDSFTLMLNEYKTSKTYGEKTIEMNAEVSKVIRRWFRTNKSGYLLADSTHADKPLGSNGITKSLARTGERKFNKRLGSSLLRHSYLSHKYADVAEEKAKDADMMGHSVEMADGYIKT